VAHFAVTAIGADRPGIVAGLTEALHGLGGNLEDVTCTILRGHFAMMLVVDEPAGVTADRVERALEEAARPLGVMVTVRDVETRTPPRPPATHVLTAYGSDRPGIVAALSRILASGNANITDLSCRLSGEGDRALYTMVAEVAVPPELDVAILGGKIDEVGGNLGVDVTFRPIEVETL
jgi:glycine cleavage system transcriptional repressor